ncbi:MAG: aminopeptidase [Acidobacteriota bacterium]|nr:aminopeptidase [Acidobacteriota bacterium]
MRILRRSVVLTLFLIATFTLTQAQRRERLIDSWRPTHYDVTLTLNNQLTELTSAKTEITVAILKGPLSTLDFDFGAMPVDSVSVGSATATFQRSSGQLNVALSKPARTGEQLKITVVYHGRPNNGLVLAADKAGNPAAIGDNWPDRTHYWIPCFDHPSAKATVNFTVTAPARDTVIANGQLATTAADEDGTRTWTYNESRPIPPYCMIIAVGEFAHSQPPETTVTKLDYYVPQTDKDYAVVGFSAAPSSLSYLSETVAPYPYEKLALIVGATRFGAMENSSAIVFASNLFEERTPTQPQSSRFKIRRGIVETTAHEIAHQWFGDSVAIRTWCDLWLSEGFATYFAGLVIERFEGRDAFREYMRRRAETYLGYERGRRAPIYDTETTDLFKLLNPNNYDKGAWVLHMLRGLLGDTAFFKGIGGYYLAHQNGSAGTEDLRNALEKASGMDLKDFFARWIYASGHPQYEVSWTWNAATKGSGFLELRLRQTQEDVPFLTPLSVELVLPKTSRRIIVTPTGRETTTRIPLQSRPMEVRIDPDEMVLKELVVKPVS